MFEDKSASLWARALLGLIVGIVYATWISQASDALMIGALAGFAMGIGTGILDHWVFGYRLRRRRLITVLLVRTTAYLLVICFCLIVTAGGYVMIKERVGGSALLQSGVLQDWVIGGSFTQIVIFAFFILLFIQLVVQVSRLLGRNVLLNYLLGRYYTPKEEERIFMFLDIKSSTTLAEKLGHFKWHKMLNDFFFDLAEPIKRSRGEIYQYVGDEVVITWPKKRGIKDLNCIRCFFWIESKISARRQQYNERYGFFPMFKAGYHIGKVVAGEIGDYKRSIVFHGDAINTASRIQSETNTIGRRLLLSQQLLQELNLNGQYREEYIGIIKLRGKEEEVTLFSLDAV